MNHSESNLRRFWAGLMAAALLALSGGCDNAALAAPDPAEGTGQTLSAPLIGHKEGDMVTVRVPVPDEPASRSIAYGIAPYYATYYEVIFLKDKTGAPAFYRGAGYLPDVDIQPNQENIITVEVSAFAPQWYTVKRGNAMVNQFMYSSILGLPTDRTKSVNDFVFSASLASPEYTYDLDEDGKQDENETWETVQVLAKPRLVQVAGDPTYGATKINRLTDTFTVKFNIAKFWLLIQADWKPSDDRAAKGTLSIAGYKAVVSPYTGDGTVSTSTFSPVYLTLNDVTLDPTRDATTGTHLERFGGNKELITVLDISPFGIISFTNRPGAITAPIPAWETEKQMLPNFDVDAVLQFELYYHAFGDPKFGGQRWTIRNGLFDYQEETVCRSMMRPMLLRLRVAAFQPEAGF